MAAKRSSGGKTAYQQGIIRRYYEHQDTIALQKLSELVSDIAVAEPGQAKKLWERAGAALMKVTPPGPESARIIRERDLEALARIVGELTTGARPVGAEVAGEPGGETSITDDSASDVTPDDPLSPDVLKRAMKAFRKRLKLTRLNEESKLGRSPMTGGKKSQVSAIMPPREYPEAVWEELVRQGKLRKAGRSFYELVE